jgi:hypothetical protein
MKANISLTKRFVPKWRENDKADVNEQLVATFQMPELGDVFDILDRLSALGVKNTDAANVSLDQSRIIAREAGHYIPKYVTLAGNDDFSVNDVISYLPFFGLAVELLFALVEYAQPTEADTKNS